MQFVECEICNESKLPLEFIHLPCQHRFCKSCIIHHWTVKIENDAIELNCPNQCEIKLNPNQYTDLFNTQVILQFKHNIQKSKAVQNNNIICYNCKTEHKLDQTQINCDCNKQICGICGYQSHEYESCDHYILRTQDKIHVELNKKESKCCPKCHTIIYKNGGCHRMICKICKHDFQWDKVPDTSKTDLELALHKLAKFALRYTTPINPS